MPTLNWMDRDAHLKIAGQVPYRILEELSEFSYGDPDAGNMLVQGDNLVALKALLPFYAGQVKCIYIDPPYNTGSAFAQYDDNVEHSTWLELMYPRLQMLRHFLREDGSIWINLDDNEVHYCKVICDEIFGRQNFLCDIAWEKRFSPPPDTKDFGYVHDHILVYRKSKQFKRNLLPFTEEQIERYKNPDNDPRGPWQSADYTCRYNAEQRPNLYYPIVHPKTGEEIYPKRTRVWANSKEVHAQNVLENRIYWGINDRQKVPRLKNFVSEIQNGMMPMSLWKHTLSGNTQEAAKETIKLFGYDKFATPKPEKLIHTVLGIATNPGDLILDSFLGSGTTAAVAQKMGRRYIGIEMGEHAKTHCAVRLKKVIDGEQGGISKAMNWQGGGGFRFFTLGSEIFETDGSIKKGITFNQLAAHIWFSETYTPLKTKSAGKLRSPFLGVHEGVAYALLFNGILGDKSSNGGNVLTTKTLKVIIDAIGQAPYEKLVVYGEAALGSAWQSRGIEFKQTPYDVKAR